MGTRKLRGWLRLSRAGTLASLTAVAALSTAPLLAQNEPANPDPADAPSGAEVLEEVIVRGRRLSEVEADLRLHIQGFLEEVTAPARTRGYARWHRTVCVGVHNLATVPAQYLIDRISALAIEVGLEPGEPGCRPEINILFTTDAKSTAAQLVENDPRTFRPIGGHAGMDLGLEALDEFMESDKPVRWWHVSMPVDARMRLPAVETQGGGLCGQANCPPQITVAGPSRIHSGVVDEMQYVLIVVDGTKLPGTTWEQISDYLGVVSLAQIDPRADPSEFDSILNLFSNPAAYSGLTDWDRSYLSALYAFDQERVPVAQRNDIVSRIAKRELEGAD